MPAAFSTTSGYGTPLSLSDGSLKEIPVTKLLGLILTELQVTNAMLREGLGLADSVESYRADASFVTATTLTNPT